MNCGGPDALAAALTTAVLGLGLTACDCGDYPEPELWAEVSLPGFDFDGTHEMEVTWNGSTRHFVCDIPGESSGYTEEGLCPRPPGEFCRIGVECGYRKLRVRDNSRLPANVKNHQRELLLFRPGPDARIHEIELVFRQDNLGDESCPSTDKHRGVFEGHDLSWSQPTGFGATP